MVGAHKAMVLGCRDPYFIGGGPYSSVIDGGGP